METLKFTLEKKDINLINQAIWPILIYAVFVLGFPVYEIIFEGADVETFETYEVIKSSIFFCFLSYFMYPVFYNQVKLRRVKQKWGKLNSNLIAIPKKELKEIEELEDTIKIQTNSFSFEVNKNAFENLDQFTVIPDKSGDESLILWLLKWFILAFLFIFSILFFIHAKNNSMVDRYNPKYHISPLKIETTQINAKYLRKLPIKSPLGLYTSEKHKVLIDTMEVVIRAVAEADLLSRIYNPLAFDQLQNGDLLKIKVRTEDYQRLGIFDNSDKQMRFYELKANGEILLQKRGLKN